MDNWMKEFKGAITVCDKEGIIVYMNDQSVENYMEFGGASLMGKNLLNCHSEATRPMLNKMLLEPSNHHYTIEKKGVKKLISHTSWMVQGEVKGIIESIMIIPIDMPHFIRK